MRRAWTLGVCLVVAGCGGALSGGVDGAGGGAAGSTGTGAAGGATAGSPFLGTYTWGDVSVRIISTSMAPGYLIVQVFDPTSPVGRIFNYPSTTGWAPTDGAYVEARYGCASTALYQVDLHSCGSSSPVVVTTGAVTPACVDVSFNAQGITGSFVDTDGTRCDIGSGSAMFQIPPPDLDPSPEGPPSPPGTAGGQFKVDCARGDGTYLRLEGIFIIPAASSFLAC